MTESDRVVSEQAESERVEHELNESVLRADRWSPYIALGVAIVLYSVGLQLRPDVQFNAIIAAFAAVGVRLYVPYHASIQVPADERVPISEQPTAGSYHHGAVGLGLVAGSMAAFGAHVVGMASTPALGLGVGVTVIGVFALRLVLPQS